MTAFRFDSFIGERTVSSHGVEPQGFRPSAAVFFFFFYVRRLIPFFLPSPLLPSPPRWMHAACQNLNTEEEVEKAADDSFDCTMCRAHMPPSQGEAPGLLEVLQRGDCGCWLPVTSPPSSVCSVALSLVDLSITYRRQNGGVCFFSPVMDGKKFLGELNERGRGV